MSERARVADGSQLQDPLALYVDRVKRKHALGDLRNTRHFGANLKLSVHAVESTLVKNVFDTCSNLLD